jgi:hypothetical protein
LIVGLVGATGNVGEEILQGLAERRFPLGDLRLFASEGSDGVHLDFLEDEIRVETAHPDALARCDLLICAAPLDPAVLGGLRGRVALLDLSGALESDLAVPLVAGPLSSGPAGDVAAAARGVTAGLAWVLHALAEESAIVRATITTLEGAGSTHSRSRPRGCSTPWMVRPTQATCSRARWRSTCCRGSASPSPAAARAGRRDWPRRCGGCSPRPNSISRSRACACRSFSGV